MSEFLSSSTFLTGLLPIIVIIVWYIIANSIYKKGTYYTITKVPLLLLRNDKGRFGEYLIYKHLKKYEETGAKFLFNVYIPKENGETSEIDVLMLCSKGIFVFESKNYSGWIFGNENQKNWYQTLPQGKGKSRKEHFYNPVMQNAAHIKHLNSFLREDIPMHSIITFSDRCTLKNISIKSNNIFVIHRNSVLTTVEQIFHQSTEEILNSEKIAYIYNKLYPYTQVDEQTKENHIENILQKTNSIISPNISSDNSMTEKENTITSPEENTVIHTIQTEADKKELYCPKCNSILLLRTATKGTNAGKQFYGCSNFPKCRYIQKY